LVGQDVLPYLIVDTWYQQTSFMANLKKVFSKIYDQYIEKIYRFIFLKVNSEEIAQDLTSETFLRGWESFKEKEEKIENPSAFLYQIARNLVIDHYREKGKAQVVSAEFAQILDPRPNMEENAILRSDVEQIREVLTEIKEDYQNVIIWHYLDDLPICEVAKLLDRSEEATRVLLHRALESLRKKVNNA
jgi:RNA polymerase sigma-70 factor (ECF subfamily)